MSDYLPRDIIRNILSRLPVESLIKCTVVCKLWRSMIKSGSFIQSHLTATIHSNNQKDTHLLLISGYTFSDIMSTVHEVHQHHCLHWDTPEFGEHSELINPEMASFPFSKLDVIGTYNGLVCLGSVVDLHSLTGTHVPFPVLIWNPCIRKIVMLPEPPFFVFIKHLTDEYHLRTMLAFAYDQLSNDYKVLRILTPSQPVPNFQTQVHVYSLARGSWKALSAAVIPPDIQYCAGKESYVLINGSLHWVDSFYTDPPQSPLYIQCFHASTEMFGEIMLPRGLGNKGICKVSKSEESLAVVKNKGLPLSDPNFGYDVWVMKEYSVAESWTHLFSIVMVRAVDIYGFKRCGEVVLRETNSNCESRTISFDTKNNQVIKVFRGGEYQCYFVDSFVESLVMLDHLNAISYPESTTRN